MRKYVIGLILLVAITIAIGLASVTTNIGINLTISGLGNSTISYSKSFSAVEPDAVSQQYRKLAVAGTSEEIGLGDVVTVGGMIIACIDDDDSNSTGGLAVDPNYVSSFRKNIQIAEGEAAYFKPVGVVHVVGPNSTERPLYEYVVLGTR